MSLEIAWCQLTRHSESVEEKPANTNMNPMFTRTLAWLGQVRNVQMSSKKNSMYCRTRSLQKLTFPTGDRGGIIYYLPTSVIYPENIVWAKWARWRTHFLTRTWPYVHPQEKIRTFLSILWRTIIMLVGDPFRNSHNQLLHPNKVNGSESWDVSNLPLLSSHWQKLAGQIIWCVLMGNKVKIINVVFLQQS
jgi:hypothetical protein